MTLSWTDNTFYNDHRLYIKFNVVQKVPLEPKFFTSLAVKVLRRAEDFMKYRFPIIDHYHKQYIDTHFGIIGVHQKPLNPENSNEHIWTYTVIVRYQISESLGSHLFLSYSDAVRVVKLFIMRRLYSSESWRRYAFSHADGRHWEPQPPNRAPIDEQSEDEVWELHTQPDGSL